MNKKLLLFKQIFFIAFLCLVGACTEEEKDDNILLSELNAPYTNKMSASLGRDTLVLTYNGDDLFGKEIYFTLTKKGNAEITLFNILPGQPKTFINNSILVKKDQGYSFSGDFRTENNINFSYMGEVKKGQLTFDIRNVKIENNILLDVVKWEVVKAGNAEMRRDEEGSYRYYREAYYLTWDPLPDSPLIGTVNYIVKVLLNNVFGSFLRDLTFLEDGNMVATYAPIPEKVDFLEDFIKGTGFTNRPEEDWTLTTANQLHYYVEGTTLFVRPNAEMIVRQIQTNQLKARAEEEVNFDFNLIQDAYKKITEWFTVGVPLTIKENPQQPYWFDGYRMQTEGDLIVYLNKSELEAFLPLLPYVMDLLPEKVLSNEVMGMTVEELLELIIEGVTNADVFEVGMYLNKSHN